MPKKEILDPREQQFVAEYVANGGNATQAAIKAGYSETGADVQGVRLLGRARIQSGIEKSLRAQIKRTELSGDRVLLELWRILNVDIADAYLPNGELKPIHEIPENCRRAISGIEVDEIWEKEYEDGKMHTVQVGVTKKVKFWSKTESAKLLGQHLKLWVERMGLEGFVNGVSFTLNIKT